MGIYEVNTMFFFKINNTKTLLETPFPKTEIGLVFPRGQKGETSSCRQPIGLASSCYLTLRRTFFGADPIWTRWGDQGSNIGRLSSNGERCESLPNFGPESFIEMPTSAQKSWCISMFNLYINNYSTYTQRNIHKVIYIYIIIYILYKYT